MTASTANHLAASSGMSRRNLLAGLGAATAAAAGLAALPGSTASAAPRFGAGPHPQVLPAPTPGLTYLPVDATAFFSYSEGGRYYAPEDGVRSLVTPYYLYASLGIPTGAVIKQLQVIYKGVPIAYIDRRGTGTPAWESLFNTGALPNAATPNALSFDVDIPVEAGATYALRAYAEVSALPGITPGSILGMIVGYVPAASAFIPFAGPGSARVLDTRVAGGKIAAGEERTVTLTGVIPTARAAVVNLTATETEAFGFFSAYRADIAYPGTSTLNWSGAGQTVANTVIVSIDPAGRIKIRGGESRSHAIIDVIGSLL